MFCKHRWEEIATQYNAPALTLQDFTAYTEEQLAQLMRMMYGFTVKTLQCTKCHDQKFITVVGKTS